MINGDVKEFISGLHYGDERFFLYNSKKYLVQGWNENEKLMIVLYTIEDPCDDYEWQAVSDNGNYPVAEFEEAKIFDGKSFWEIEKDIEWVDC